MAIQRPKLRQVDDAIQRLSGHIAVWPWVAAVLTAIITSLAVALGSATNFVRMFAPLSYLFVAIFAIIAVIFMLWLVFAFFRWLSRPDVSPDHEKAHSVIHAPTIAVAFDKIKITRRTTSATHKYSATATAKVKTRDVIVTARYAPLQHTFGGAYWQWSKPELLFRREVMAKGELIDLDIAIRNADISEDTAIVLGQKIDIQEARRDLSGTVIAVEITLSFDDTQIQTRRCITFRFADGKALTDLLDMDTEGFAGVKDARL